MKSQLAIFLLSAVLAGGACAENPRSTMHDPTLPRDQAAAARTRPALTRDLAAKHLEFGAPVFLRAFKESLELELFVLNRKTGKFELFRNYAIAKSSGELGPKIAEGDGQVPEGFYAVPPAAMNPKSQYHLSFNIGYPNAFDRAHHRTGSAIMIHGNRVSIGCLAMTDEKIEEIYTLCAAAHASGQKAFSVHIFPFRMTEARMTHAAGSEWVSFWKNLKQAYDSFESTHHVPEVTVHDGQYKILQGKP